VSVQGVHSLAFVPDAQQVEGLVPAINPEFLVKSKPKRKIKPKRFDNFESYQFVKNNSKVLETTACNTEQYKNSFFVKSVSIHSDQKRKFNHRGSLPV
jgi:hypothetical protein